MHIVFPPHMGRHKYADLVDNTLIYPFIKRLKKSSGGRLWLLDFESPDWKAEVDDTVMHGYRNVFRVMEEFDVVLSTTKTGMEYAKNFYGKLNPSLIFKQLYLCVNSVVADSIGYHSERENRAVVFYRTGEAHKNNESIVNMIKSLPEGFSLLMLGRFRDADESFFQELRQLGKNYNISIEREPGVSEKRKFEILATSRLLFFGSKFEGYGLPPVEAQYVGTPVVCSKLPVLIEVNKYAVFADFDNNEDLKVAVRKALSLDCGQLHEEAESFASVTSFCSHLQQIALDLEKGQ